MRVRPSLLATVASLLLAVSVVAGVAVAQTAGPSTTFVFVARGDNPIDALGAAPVAGRLDAPVLLTLPGTLSDTVRGVLDAAPPDVVVIAGGAGAVSLEVEAEIRAVVPATTEVRRVEGGNRYETAGALAALIGEYEPAFAYEDTDTDTNAFGITCENGEVLQGIDGAGAPVCVEDRDTDTDTDTNAFDIACADDELVMTGIDDSGTEVCGDPAARTAQAVFAVPAQANTGQQWFANGIVNLAGRCEDGQLDQFQVLVTVSGTLRAAGVGDAGEYVEVDVAAKKGAANLPNTTRTMTLNDDLPAQQIAITTVTTIPDGAVLLGLGYSGTKVGGGAAGTTALQDGTTEVVVLGHECVTVL